MIKNRIQLRGLLTELPYLCQVLLEASQRGFVIETAMGSTVIDLLNPGPEPGIEIVQVIDARDYQLTQELVTESPMPAFQFALALGRIRSAVNQPNIQSRTNALQGGRAIGRAVIDHQLFR
jgi:hypothetical protein